MSIDPATVWAVASTVVTVAAAGAAALPQPKPGSWLAVVRGVLDVLAVNVGNARNVK